ncbi:MAG: PD-(D/E)XK nuclease family protein, partial [Actinomycetota bacterium]|nr:PD-(D/E)XK nuclease family protein [Actinomycetota bacterium]
SEPSGPRAAELARRRESVRRVEAKFAAARPLPILPGGPSPVPLGHLSYSSLDAYKRCAYRFYVERVLGVGAGMLSPPARNGNGDDPPQARAASPALALGNAVHSALEWSARNGWARPDEARVGALLEHEGASVEQVTRASGLIDAWLGSELRASIAGMGLRAEAPFVLPVAGTVLRGSIDLLAAMPEGPLVIDFKTDRLDGSTTAALGERYASQRAIYALAAATRAGASQVRTAHVFLERPEDPVLEAFGPDDLDRARRRLEGIVAGIRAGDFEPTPEPSASLCLGCPAAARLCPHPMWRPDRHAAIAVR